MRSHERGRKPCHYCAAATTFELELTGPRGGHLRWVPCCTDCGERPSRRMQLEQEQARAA